MKKPSKIKTIRDISLIKSGLPVFVVKRGRVAAKYIDKNEIPQVTIYLTFRCPKCGKTNYHTGDGLVRGNSYGYRGSHCPCWHPDGYNIVEA